MKEPVPETKSSKFQQFLCVSAIPLNLFATILAARLIWEETILTLQQGPQMIGFSLAHGYAAILLLAPLLLILWLIVTLVTIVICRLRRISLAKWLGSSLAIAVAVLGITTIPPVFWQFVFIGKFAKSAHAADLMTDAAAEGNVRTVGRYLSHGVPLESVNYEGSTSAFTAAAGGDVNVMKLLVSKGANLNALNAYGDSPLEAATENHNDSVASFLRAHGAAQIEGTPEQRQAAAKAIVNREIYRQSSK